MAPTSLHLMITKMKNVAKERRKKKKTRESTDSRTIVSIKERENTVKYKQHLCSSNMIF